MKRSLKHLFLSFCLLSSCSEKPIKEDYSLFVKVDEIVTNVESLELYVNESFTLTAEIKPTSATVKTITFESDNPSVALCSSSGKVEGRSEGSCNINIYSDDNNVFKKTIPVLIKKEDRNREKEGTIKIDANLDFSTLASENIDSRLLSSLNYNDEVYAPFVNTFNTTNDDFLDLSEHMKLLNDINYYGNIANESEEERSSRILSNMKALFVISTGVNTILSAIGSDDASSYANYHNSITSNYLALIIAKEIDDRATLPILKNNLKNAIRNSPEQHSLIYVNNDYLSNAKLEETSSSKKCTHYLYQSNYQESNNFISALTPLMNYTNVQSVKDYYTQENVNTLLTYMKNNFDKLPAAQSSIYYQLLRILINSIDENDYLISTSDIYTIDDKEAIDANFALTESGKNKISETLVNFITTRTSTSDNEDLKNRINNYLDGFALTKFENKIVFVNRESGSGVNVYKVENTIEFKTSTLSNQSINTEILYFLNTKEIPSSFFFEEETRQQSYKNQ